MISFFNFNSKLIKLVKLVKLTKLIKLTPLKSLWIAAMLGLLPLWAVAGAGHDHGEAPVTATASTQPRLVASSEVFELIGLLEGKTFTFYLDTAKDNAPVKNATLEIEIAGVQVEVKNVGEGLFEAPLPSTENFPKEGIVSITATVVAPVGSDLLVGELDIHPPEYKTQSPAHTQSQEPTKVHSLFKTLAMLGVIVIAIGALLKPKIFKPKHVVSVVLMGVLASPLTAQAGAGHDHGDAPSPVTNGNHPKRQPDGRVFLPKPAQRQLAVRTLEAIEAELPKVFELSGKVVMNPHTGGKVQAALAGRLQGGPKGLPSVGQRVRKDEVLAYVAPVTGAIEYSNQVSQQAELRSAHRLAEKRLARWTELADTVPRKDIEAAQSELASLTERLNAIGAGLSKRDVLVAPVSGVIASAHAVSGQVVEARELLFEVVNPHYFQIEALAYDAAQAQNIAKATLVLGDKSQPVPLRFLGGAHSLREQALPLMFTGNSPGWGSLGLALGQSVTLWAESKQRIQGIPLPSAALLRNPSNQTIVWVKETPEHFAPRVVTFEPLDGASVAITSGLKAGERVATQGAAFINQIR